MTTTSGYIILELNLPNDTTFHEVLDGIKDTLDGAALSHVNHVHAAIGPDGLRESVTYLLSEERS